MGGLNWVAGGSGLMRKARAGEGPGPGPAQGGAGTAPGQDLIPGQSLAPGVAPGIVPGPDPGHQGGTVAEAAHRPSSGSKLGRNNSISGNSHKSCNLGDQAFCVYSFIES